MLCNLQTKFGLSIWRGNTLFISSIIVIHDSAACSAVDGAMYLLLAVVRAISVCRRLNQKIWTVWIRDSTFSAS